MSSKNATKKQVNKTSEKRTESLHELDIEYRESVHQCNLVIKDEETRRVKVRTMIAQGEAQSLKDQLLSRDGRIKDLIDQADDVRSQLDSLQEKCRRQDKIMQTQNREIANLKEELTSFNAVAQDSSKLLSEKLALSREIGVLKPEIEHLRSQLAHQKDVLAEKLALERQLNALEVELANERRAVQKAARQNESKNQEEEDALRKEVQDLAKELAKERKIAQKKMEAQETKTQEAQEEIQSLREKLAETEKNLAAEKRKAEQSVKSKSSVTAQMEEEMEQLRQTVKELENAVAAEKRAAERKVKNKGSGSEEELTQLREELAEVKKALKDEKKEKEQLQKEHEQALVDAEERQNALGDRVEKLRSKLRDTVDELKKARAELEKVQERPVRAPSVSAIATTTVPLKKPGVKANAKKKRTVDDVAMEDKVLMTPGATDDRPKRLLKKRGFDTTVLTEKSNFSITPFLNKTLNVGDASQETSTPTAAPTKPAEPVEEEREDAHDANQSDPEPAVEEQPAAEATKPPAATKLVEKKARGRPRGATSALSESSANAKNPKVRKSPALENVAEEEGGDDDESSSNQENQQPATKPKKKTVAAAETAAPAKTKSGVHAILPDLDSSSEKEPKKKKRKLGASNPTTIFEEDEGEKVKPIVKVAAPVVKDTGAAPAAGQSSSSAAATMGAHKRPPVSGGRAAAAAGAGMKKGILGGVKNSFSAGGKTFSPLKRERRGVGASFLA